MSPLNKTINPTRKELAHNIAVIYDGTCLSSRVHLKNFKLLLEKNLELEKEVKRLKSSIKTLTNLFSKNRPLTKQEVRDLTAEISKQPKLVEEEVLRNSESYREALKATESIDPPALGFLKPIDHPGTLSHQAAVIKQHNTQLQLLVQIAEDIKGIRAEL
ncbi:hypothetical protein C4D60_Mb05t17220 [Musa balbisiana]|uniref:Uncharacterized protein n=1 Tax=Musa balbisiana TaxID=52838 RepID=A0A4S8JWS0_MUSBA|nr:hypothetical protein C4D60_Mb05t17220 [Musa balbisiana]